MIAIVDYGMGNLRSVEKALEKLGMEASVTSEPSRLEEAEGIILPGVGAFGDAMNALEESGLAGAIQEQVAAGKPFLGICLGLQLLATVGLEEGTYTGLDIVPGKCIRLPGDVKVPHMGWNSVAYPKKSRLFSGVPEGGYFYFVHSYYLEPESRDVAAGITEYGVEFVSAVEDGNVFATQFHPEKSGTIGLKVLENFGVITRGDIPGD